MIRSNLPQSIAIIVAAILWQLVLPHASRAADAPRPNVVFVITDDQRWDAMGCAGHPFIKTPNMDRIAREGAMFTNAFVTTPLCSPARSSFLTGPSVPRRLVWAPAGILMPRVWSRGCGKSQSC